MPTATKTKASAKSDESKAGKKPAALSADETKTLDGFKELVGKITDVNHSIALLHWDMESYMPEGGAEERSKQVATLSEISHELLTSKEMGQYIKKLRSVEDKLDKIDHALVRYMGREYDQAIKLPPEFVKQREETRSMAQNAWVKAREKNSFKDFAPFLEKVVANEKQVAQYLATDKKNPYNALLDLFEPENTMAKIDPLFSALRKELVPLVKAIDGAKGKPTFPFMKKKFDVDKQLAFSKQLLTDMGFDFKRGRLDKTVHPFCTSFGIDDVRPLSRFFETMIFSGIYSTIHEGGHAQVEQSADKALKRTPLPGATMGIHESQSRFWENIMGRSKGFWKHNLPRMKKLFPAQLNGVTVEQIYKAANQVQPSLIRVEADEVTYNLHIMIRYEIEKELIQNNLPIQDLPKLWNQKYKDYLGITPKSDKEGVLQDVHWSAGLIGYFPTYTLGNLYAAQFLHALKKAIPGIGKKISEGPLTATDQQKVKAWLNEKIHRTGQVYTPDEIVMRVTGEPLNAKYFVDYLWDKYGKIYTLQRPA